MCRDVSLRAVCCRSFKAFLRFLILCHPRTGNVVDLTPMIVLLLGTVYLKIIWVGLTVLAVEEEVREIQYEGGLYC